MTKEKKLKIQKMRTTLKNIIFGEIENKQNFYRMTKTKN
jgi:hypothetical protein